MTAKTATPGAERPLDTMKKAFVGELDKHGLALTQPQLKHLAREKRLNRLSSKEWRELAEFASRHPSLAKFSPARHPKNYQTIGVLRPGVYFIDYGEFYKSRARPHNDGATGFLVAVENVTNRLFVKPCRGKGTDSWLEAVRDFVELTRNVRTIFSDRDAVATSPKFRDEIMERYGVKWYFLKKGSKSYLAERYIGFVKQKLSQALNHAEKRNGDGRSVKNWIQFVERLVQQYNRQKIEGTSYSRQSIEASNFSHFLSQLLGGSVDEPELEFNASKAGPFATEAWNRRIFRFGLGDKVLLARKANWKRREGDTDQGAGVFLKASTVGGFGDRVFTVSGRQLRKTKHFKSYVPVYSLAEMGPSLHFYQRELKAVRGDETAQPQEAAAAAAVDNDAQVNAN